MKFKLLAMRPGSDKVGFVDLEKLRGPLVEFEKKVDSLGKRADDIEHRAGELISKVDDRVSEVWQHERMHTANVVSALSKQTDAQIADVYGALGGVAKAVGHAEARDQELDKRISAIPDLSSRVLKLEEQPLRVIEKVAIPVPVAEIDAAVAKAFGAIDLEKLKGKDGKDADDSTEMPPGGELGMALTITKQEPRELGWRYSTAVGGGSIKQRKALATLSARVEALESNPVGGGGTGNGDMTGPASSNDRELAIFDGVTGKLLTHGAVVLSADNRLTTLTDPTGLQDAATKNYVDDLVGSLNLGGASQNTFLVSGGQVTWQSAYTFRVSAATYYIAGILYHSVEQTITLDSAHATLARIDVIAVDSTGTVVKVSGTAASEPSEPDIDPGSQLKVSIVLVEANTVAPGTISAEYIYSDAAASGEWDISTSGAGWTTNSAVDPRSGITCIDGTNVGAGAYVQAQIPNGGSLDPNIYDFFVMNVKAKSSWANNRGLQVTFRTTGVVKGATVVVQRSGTFGFDASDTSIYQQIAIPISLFSVPPGTLINQVRVSVFGGAINLRADDISLTGGASTQPVVGITPEQAEALYGWRSSQLVISDNAGDVLTVGDRKGMPFIVPPEMNGWRLSAARGHVVTVSSSGPVTVQLHNLTRALDMLTTKITVDANEKDSKDAVASVVTTANAIVFTGDEVWVDIDAAGTGSKGLIITLTFVRT